MGQKIWTEIKIVKITWSCSSSWESSLSKIIGIQRILQNHRAHGNLGNSTFCHVVRVASLGCEKSWFFYKFKIAYFSMVKSLPSWLCFGKIMSTHSFIPATITSASARSCWLPIPVRTPTVKPSLAYTKIVQVILYFYLIRRYYIQLTLCPNRVSAGVSPTMIVFDGSTFNLLQIIRAFRGSEYNLKSEWLFFHWSKWKNL